jgi:uncharacterized membrane protein
MYRGFNGFGYGYPGFPWGWLVLGIALFVVVAGIVYIAIKLGRTKDSRIGKHEDDGAPSGPTIIPDSSSGQKALEILAERYAKGEIDAETYRAMKQELQA